MLRARLFWPAIVVSSAASFVFEGIWFSIFLQPWLAGIGHTQDWLMRNAAVSTPVQFGTALLCSLVAAIVLSLLTQWTGPQTAKRGMLLGAIVWIGFIATGWAKDYIFEVRTLQLYFINSIYSLLDLVLIGAITGAWKGRRTAA